MTSNDGSTTHTSSDARSSDAPSHDNAAVAARLGGEPLTVTARGLTFSGFRAAPGPSGNDDEGRDPQMAILVHGWPQFASSWEGIARELLGSGIAVVAYDQRAYSPGARPDGVENYTVAELAADLDAIANELGIERFHLVGHDWGGVMAWMYAAWHPERLHSLTVLSTPNPVGILETTATDESQQKKGSYITGIRDDPEGSRDALLADGAALLRSLYGDAVSADAVDAYVARLSEPGVLDATLRYYLALGTGEFPADPVITVPTLYFWGDGDIAFSRASAEKSREYTSGEYEFEILEGASHWLPEECAEDLGPAVADWIERHSS